MNGDSFMVNVESSDNIKRDGHIWLVGRDYGGNDIVSDVITIYQGRFEPLLAITPTTANIDFNGGELLFNIESDNVVNIRSASNSEWLTGTVEGNLLKINVSVNDGKQRSGKIWLEANGLSGNAVNSNEAVITQGGYETVMRFTVVSGKTWGASYISAYTADDRRIYPKSKTPTGWTYDGKVAYVMAGSGANGYNLLTYEGFDYDVEYRNMGSFFAHNAKCERIETAKMNVTSACTNFLGTFYECSGLTSLDLTTWDTSNIGDMTNMFLGCESLTSINLSGLNLSNVKVMSFAFRGCKKLTNIDFPDNVAPINLEYMFYDCSSLASLDISKWDKSKIDSIYCMFLHCTGLVSLDLSNWQAHVAAIDMIGTFTGCTSLRTITAKNCDPYIINRIKSALDYANITDNVTIITA